MSVALGFPTAQTASWAATVMADQNSLHSNLTGYMNVLAARSTEDKIPQLEEMSANHCDNCHIYSQKHELDENTSDATVSAKVGWKGGFAKASYTARSLTHGTSSVPIVAGP